MQIVYYFSAALKLGAPDCRVSFSVPTGNFGNVFACYSAHKMGLPIKTICIAVNNNDILHRFFNKNDYSKQQVLETLSPSMDISVASNFERLIYDFFLDRDATSCADLFNNFPDQSIKLDPNLWKKKNQLFTSSKVNDLDTQEAIQDFCNTYNYVIDPHTAVAIREAIDKSSESNHYAVLATAHPAKFPNIYDDIGIEIKTNPVALEGLYEKQEQARAPDSTTEARRQFACPTVPSCRVPSLQHSDLGNGQFRGFIRPRSPTRPRRFSGRRDRNAGRRGTRGPQGNDP